MSVNAVHFCTVSVTHVTVIITEQFSSTPSIDLVCFSSPPVALMTILSTCEELCESILAGVQVGEFAVVQPHSVEYSCILGYLLAWKLLLTFFKSAPAHVRPSFELLCDIDFSMNTLASLVKE